MNSLQEALAAVGEEKLEATVRDTQLKFPAGKTIVAVELGRNENVSGERTTLVDANWQFAGRAVALKNGHCICANYLFAHISKGVPKVTACHLVSRKGDTVPTLVPLAVWAAKDNARRAGVTDAALEELSGFQILELYGQEWKEDSEAEKKGLIALTDRALKALEAMEKVEPFLGPQAFTVRPIEEEIDLGQGWSWLIDAMRVANKAAVPFRPGDKGEIIVHNPGFWLGWVDDPHETELFFREKGEGKRRAPKPAFNPKTIHGL